MSGPYGTGKSHALAVFRYVAMQDGFLVAEATLDQAEVSLSSPQALFHALASTIRGDAFSEEFPVLGLFRRAIRRGAILEPVRASSQGERDDRLLKHYTTLQFLEIHGLLDDGETAQKIEGVLSAVDQPTASELRKELSERFFARTERRLPAERFAFQSVIAYSPKEKRPSDWLEGMLGMARLACAAGYRGLVVTIDEVEIESSKGSRAEAADAFLATLERYFIHRLYGTLTSTPLIIVFAHVAEEGGRCEMLRRLVENSKESTLTLRPWSDEELKELARRIVDVFTTHYRVFDSFAPRVSDELLGLLKRKQRFSNDLVRSFIKWLIGLSDLRFGPSIKR